LRTKQGKLIGKIEMIRSGEKKKDATEDESI
jgi:hypothetical protein